MSNWIIYSIGFLAQLLFSGRLFIQWFLSEKNKRIITPSLFWKLSLTASFLLFVYGYLRNDFAIMFGQTFTYFIYVRNLYFQGEWQKHSVVFRAFLLFFPIIIVIYGYNNGNQDIKQLLNNSAIPSWLFWLGVSGQSIFTMRFIYQWLYSERKKVSHLPVGFWRLSVVGALLILVYGIFRKDPVLLIGHGSGLLIYLRNIYIEKNEVPI
tara:strand:- start:1436 stop:2062 length:627 start_codon:yes stop_codon:yes gene_type:complete